jgi:hypothetical protein
MKPILRFAQNGKGDLSPILCVLGVSTMKLVSLLKSLASGTTVEPVNDTTVDVD